jgi:hypothetical protein
MNRSRKMRWADHVTCIGVMINAYEILVGKPEEKRPVVDLVVHHNETG